MDLLRDNELIYGRLLPVEEPHLIERYNKALKAFGLPPTAREKISIDRTGFSPEVAEDLGDIHYLDPNQINRYADSEFRYSDKSDDAAVDKLLRDARLRERAVAEIEALKAKGQWNA